LASLRQALHTLCAALGSQQPAAAATLPDEGPSLAERVAELLALLRDNDGDVGDWILSHSKALRAGLGESFSAVERATQQYDYDAALTLLELLAKRAGITISEPDGTGKQA
uniref:hypothetical protein n=1 Tax=Chitinimonas sp. TaxID=1934313 RepID=UPI0035B1E3DF